MEKSILDCGAGGTNPPLSLFYQHGFAIFGIEIQENALAEARLFCRENKMPLNIIRGDMRMIPFADETFGFAYSYNAIFFMTKPDIKTVIGEMERVLKPHGLCFVNFKSVDDPDDRAFCETGFARRLLNSERFSKFEDEEADSYFGDFEILRKEKRLIDKKLENRDRLKQAFIDYIARKK
ncbi:MAG: class I SAM-dependent methyltransferase [Candidatus Zixiibacteriota bacterium]|nr:MAG: class I SAM-dependent methyltransferase [candidate division Zixibacteria bacterium]